MLAVKDIWRNHRSGLCLKKHEFETYFEGCTNGYAIILSEVTTFKRPFSLEELRVRFGFEPPQSFLYAAPQFVTQVRDAQQQAPH